MHNFYNFFKLVNIYVIFQLFLIINHSFSDHLTAKISNYNDATSPIYVWGYDRKFFFDGGSAPLFIVSEKDINYFNKINLRAFPHVNIGLFVYQDVDRNGEFTKDFKGYPLEPHGFSLNPKLEFQKVTFEDIAFDMNKFNKIEIKLSK